MIKLAEKYHPNRHDEDGTTIDRLQSLTLKFVKGGATLQFITIAQMLAMLTIETKHTIAAASYVHTLSLLIELYYGKLSLLNLDDRNDDEDFDEEHLFWKAFEKFAEMLSLDDVE
jgi:hypothetical protein